MLARADKTIVEPSGVAPYLPIDRARRVEEPAPAGNAQQGGGGR